jgi:HEAT repeat protein
MKRWLMGVVVAGGIAGGIAGIAGGTVGTFDAGSTADLPPAQTPADRSRPSAARSVARPPALTTIGVTTANDLQALRDPDRPGEHRDALERLATTGTPEALAGVFEAFVQRRSLLDARDAAAALVHHPSEPAIEGLRRYLGDDTLALRVSALEVLSEYATSARAELQPAIRAAIARDGQATLTAAREGGPALRKAADRIATRLGSLP